MVASSRPLIGKTIQCSGNRLNFCELRAANIHYDTSHMMERRKDRGCCELSVTNRPDAMRIASLRQLY
jgi:hypothetical protein